MVTLDAVVTDGGFCSDKPDGFYTYPEDPTKFYQCAGGQTYIMSCAPGLEFNGETCDYPKAK